MILGRSPNVILGAFTAIFNVVVLSAVLGHLDGSLVAAINVAAAAVIAVIANSGPVEQAGTKALKG